MTDTVRVQVLLQRTESERFAQYCRENGYKKSTLIARLIKEHLDRESYPAQRQMFLTIAERSP